MKFNFKKISVLATSALLVGMTAGVAVSAANYPAPFVDNGNSNVYIVVGSGDGASQLDSFQAGFIATDLQRRMGGSNGDDTTTTGETVSLGTSTDKIWLNTSLNSVKSQLTKSDLPNTLADYTFSGNVESKLTHTIKLVAGAAAGGENSGKVIFAAQPKSSDDPVVGLSLGSSQTSYPLYNATATMSAINFTHAETEGEEIELFGQKFTIASATSTTELVLLKEAEKVFLDNIDNPSAEVVIGGETYTIELVSASETTADIKVTNSAGVSANKEISEAASKKVNGVTIAVQTASSTTFALSASIIVGAEKITIRPGTTITTGDSGDPIKGTYAYITGGTIAATEITVAVFYPGGDKDAILPGESFVDPFTGNFKVDFAGLNSPLDSTARDTIEITNSGVKDLQVTFTEQDGNEGTFNFAHNQSSQLFLGNTQNNSIATMEMTNLTYGSNGRKFVVVGNEDYGHLIELTYVYNLTTGTNAISGDDVWFSDVMIPSTTYETTFTSEEGTGTVDIDGKRYNVTYTGDGETAVVQLKYPTTESASANVGIAYPTIETISGNLVTLYEPLTLVLNNFDSGAHELTTLKIPDGDGYTSFTLGPGNSTNNYTWTFGGVPLNTSAAADTNYTSLTVGQLTYNMTSTGTVNQTKLYVTDPEGSANIDQPALILMEGKGDTTANDYHAIVFDIETAPAGTSSDQLGLQDVLFSSPTHWEVTQNTDSDIIEHLDFYGTHVLYDSNVASQSVATITVPNGNVFAELYVGEIGSSVNAGTDDTVGSNNPLGDVVILDSEVGTAGSRNLIIVGGSCINSAAATLVGGEFCGQAWTDATDVGAGEFMIKGYTGTSLTTELAVLVAGYNVDDTTNAATYLRNQVVDTSKHYKGTSSTNAEVIETA